MSDETPIPPLPADVSDQLEPLRERIDALDEDILRLLNERASVVVKVGDVKRNSGTGPIYVPHRESAVLERVANLNRGGLLPERCVKAIWRELMSGSFALERPLRIGYLGPQGSYSQQAAMDKFGASVEYDNMHVIGDIFDEVARGHVDYGIVPVENSTEGSVSQTLDEFMTHDVRVCAEILLEVRHHLFANCEAPQIQRIYSHPQALAQCSRWLSAQFPNVDKVATSSTSRAVEIAAGEDGAAAVGSELAGKLFGVHRQFDNITDHSGNTTRFYVLSKQTTLPTGSDKTALMFTTSHRAGALVEVLQVFHRHGINLTHIDKRPIEHEKWKYCFFIDFEGHQLDEKVITAISEAQVHCTQLRVLGSFPRAVLSDEQEKKNQEI